MDGSPICRRQLNDTSAMAKGISPDIEVLREVPEELKARIDTRGEASLRGHLKTEGGRRGAKRTLPCSIEGRSARQRAAFCWTLYEEVENILTNRLKNALRTGEIINAPDWVAAFHPGGMAGRMPRSGHPSVVFRHGTEVRCAAQKRGELKMTTSVLNATDGPDIRSVLEPRLSGASCLPVISRTGELDHLAQADGHIAEVKRHFTRQRLRVEHALDTGQRSELADSMLHAFEASLRAFEKHRKLVLNQLKRRLAPGSQDNRGRTAAGAEGDCRTTRTATLGEHSAEATSRM
jgi:hypothetical protein